VWSTLASGITAVATVALAVVGGFAARAAVRTLRAIEGQVKAAIDSERPWVMLESLDPKNFSGEGRSGILSGTITFKNFGKSPAWIVESVVRFVKCAPNAPLIYGDPVRLPSGEPVPPNHTAVPVEVQPEPLFSLGDQDWEQIEGQEEILRLYGYVKYRDAFFEHTKCLRETYFCLRYHVTLVERFTDQDGRWVYDGPPEANRHN
jgi:hypothetical protein